MKNKENKRYLKILLENIDSEVVFMSYILFLILALMASVTLNVALLTVCYIQYVNKIIDKE